MHKQKLITGILILITVGLLGIVIIGSKNKDKDTTVVNNNQSVTENNTAVANTPVFFYGNTCPHCAEVEKWMEENKIDEKINVVKKEVYDNQGNALELTQAAKSCGIPTENIGVPFLYADEKCYVGTPEVTGYLSEKAGLNGAEGNTK